MKSLILHSSELRSLLDTGRCEVRRRVHAEHQRTDRGYSVCNLPSPFRFGTCHGRIRFDVAGGPGWRPRAKCARIWWDGDGWEAPTIVCPLGSPGEVRWCKETWNIFVLSSDGEVCTPLMTIPKEDPRLDDDSRYLYVVDYKCCGDTDEGPWRSASSMPRWASRLTVRVVSVSVERVEGGWWWVGDVERCL